MLCVSSFSSSLPSPLADPPVVLFQDTPRTSCVYRAGLAISRGCSYTCVKKIQVCPEPLPHKVLAREQVPTEEELRLDFQGSTSEARMV